MREALYGTGGFYTRGERPAAHFRTSVHASPAYADAVLALVRSVDEALGRPDHLDLVDLGSGEAELLTQVLRLAGNGLAARLRLCAVELAPRPAGLTARIHWQTGVPRRITGLILANEWLDSIPVDVAELAADGPRLVFVDPVTGAQRLGRRLRPPEQAWLARWWPLREVGDRAEIGLPQCAAWAAAVGCLRRGAAIAADYAHSARDRPAAGTLRGYREGHAVPAIPDGSCDLTAHVALDGCAAAGTAAGVTATLLTTQRDALRALGLHGRRPPLETARSDPRGYAESLCRAAAEAELLDSGGLGGFGWLVQTIGIPLPAALACAR
jgi:SAM-dependent MidA family methyltransferase